jgi:hypothetical protein
MNTIFPAETPDFNIQFEVANRYADLALKAATFQTRRTIKIVKYIGRLRVRIQEFG